MSMIGSDRMRLKKASQFSRLDELEEATNERNVLINRRLGAVQDRVVQNARHQKKEKEADQASPHCKQRIGC